MMDALCIICVRPDPIWCDFLNSFQHYKIYILIDDEKFAISRLVGKYKNNVSFIIIPSLVVGFHHYKDMNFTVGKNVTGWEKAMYYFYMIQKRHRYIWFLEEDVFFHHQETLVQIDREIPDADLLSPPFQRYDTINLQEWHWDRINIGFNPPYYHGMMCAVRFSKSMLECIYQYAQSFKTLFFLEALFPTLAMKNGLVCQNPPALNTIFYKKDFCKEEVREKNLYHPVKNLQDHILFRNQ